LISAAILLLVVLYIRIVRLERETA
jgi:hypothetical protein